MLAVLVTGIVLVLRGRGRIGARRAAFVLAGLAALALDLVLSTAWLVVAPTLITQLDVRASAFGVYYAVINFFLAALTAAGVGLLVAAALTTGRPPGGPEPQATADPPPPGPSPA